MTRIAILDDWQDVARSSADWFALERRAEIVSFTRPFDSMEAVAKALADFDIVIAMRERTVFSAALIERLPRLRMIALTGVRSGTLDFDACTARRIGARARVRARAGEPRMARMGSCVPAFRDGSLANNLYCKGPAIRRSIKVPRG